MKGLVDYFIVSQYRIEEELRKESENKITVYDADLTFEEVSDEILDFKIKEFFEE